MSLLKSPLGTYFQLFPKEIWEELCKYYQGPIKICTNSVYQRPERTAGSITIYTDAGTFYFYYNVDPADLNRFIKGKNDSVMMYNECEQMGGATMSISKKTGKIRFIDSGNSTFVLTTQNSTLLMEKFRTILTDYKGGRDMNEAWY